MILLVIIYQFFCASFCERSTVGISEFYQTRAVHGQLGNLLRLRSAVRSLPPTKEEAELERGPHVIVALMTINIELPKPRNDSRLFEGFTEVIVQLRPLVEMHGHWMLSAGGGDHRGRFWKKRGIFRKVCHAERRRHDDQL